MADCITLCSAARKREMRRKGPIARVDMRRILKRRAPLSQSRASERIAKLIALQKKKRRRGEGGACETCNSRNNPFVCTSKLLLTSAVCPSHASLSTATIIAIIVRKA